MVTNDKASTDVDLPEVCEDSSAADHLPKDNTALDTDEAVEAAVGFEIPLVLTLPLPLTFKDPTPPVEEVSVEVASADPLETLVQDWLTESQEIGPAPHQMFFGAYLLTRIPVLVAQIREAKLK